MDVEHTPVAMTSAHLLVMSADESAILSADDREQHRLPVLTVRCRTRAQMLARLLARVRATFGIDLPILDIYPANDPPEELFPEVLVTAGPPPPSWVPPPGVRWSAGDVTDLSAPPVLAGRLRTLVEEMRLGIAPPPLRVPWARSGWHARAVAWIEERLAAIHRPPTGPIRLQRTWSLSQVMWVPTHAGRVYFKAAAALPFGHEAALTAYLASTIPEHAPVVLAFDSAERWLLTEDFGGRELAEHDPADLELGLPAVIEIQRALLGKARELVGVGCLDRPLSNLSADLVEALEWARATGLAVDGPTIKRIAVWVRRGAEHLDRLGLPPTLVHGDLHPANAVTVGGRVVLFDWAEGAVANPLLDLYSWLRSAREPSLRERLREACVQGWAGIADPNLIRFAFEDAAIMSLAYQTVSWVLYLRAFEPELRTVWIDPLGRRIQQLAKVAGA
jgi:hypothetical protein